MMHYGAGKEEQTGWWRRVACLCPSEVGVARRLLAEDFKELGREWRSLSPTQKERYNTLGTAATTASARRGGRHSRL